MGLRIAALTALAGTAGLVLADGAGTLLDPVQPILTPNGRLAQNPLGHLGANGPWQIGPNVNNISPDVPEGCVVDQAAYVSRHGSRYPDSGAYAVWVAMAEKFKENTYNATGPLAFIHDWTPPLSNPAIEIAQESKTGYKELFGLGYTLRLRYPDLYQEGDPFFIWANNYTRVIQTAQLFAHGYLGINASLATVVSVTSKGFPSHLGDSLAPSDMCPTFVDDSDSQTHAWRKKWMPAYIARLSQYVVSGHLNLTDDEFDSFPYICGFESQITGHLSPFCDTFNDEELAAYEYEQDLRYYYGVGPGTKVASKMMVPFLDGLVQRLVDGPDAEGKDFTGGTFKLPKLLMSFLNDGQLVELATATGVFDKQKPLPVDHIAQDRLWHSSRITPMRGTIAFERLTCNVQSSSKRHGSSGSKQTDKPHKNKVESFIRIRFNDAVYPLPSCKDGPGGSCGLQKYAKYISDKNKKIGSFAKLCNATAPGTPTGTVKGASFFTDLAQPNLQAVKP
ncbi:hypothetical protein NLU13_9925 [Sarocladium strictum]|uniref:3-phytase n=1 Tax=Sarocladium strictum TaxID=5046 RepID=A0AA39G8X2_SARSR|nr:hypothetical protein NLU13_9925 [Sarocladium strictum]